MSELKPCPFCGGEAQINDAKNSRQAEGYSLKEVTCLNCGAKVWGKGIDYFRFEKTHEDVKSAIEAWNRRV